MSLKSILSTVVNAVERFVFNRRSMSMDEVNQALAACAADREAATREKLDWQTSVTDLLKLLNLDSSFQARRALAEELGMSGMFVGSPEQNVELRALVMASIEKRCTKIP